MSLAENSQHFYLAYRHFEEKEQEQFAMLANRLLTRNFICRDHEKDKKIIMQSFLIKKCSKIIFQS